MMANTFAAIDIEAELTLFLCSSLAFFILVSFRNSKVKRSGKSRKSIMPEEVLDPVTEFTPAVESKNDSRYLQLDKDVQAAFEAEDYWQVLTCWNELKYFHQSSIHLPMIIRAMRSCNKGAFFVMAELRTFFKANPQARSIGLINDLLEPLSRSVDEAQLVDHLVRMIPSINLHKNSRTYEILLTMHAANGNLLRAQEIVAEMKTKEISFTPRAAVAVMTMGLQAGDVDAVLKAFVKLKASWDVRGTWAVSTFAVERHKKSILMQIATLACGRQKVCELSFALDGMAVPEEVIDILEIKLSCFSDVDLATAIAVLKKSGRVLKADPIYNTLVRCLSSRSKKMTRSVRGRCSADSDASTSEGSRSESEDSN